MRREKRRKLVSYIASDYFEAAQSLRASAPVVAYVEGYDDVTFWRSIFDEFESAGTSRHFEVTTPVRNDLAKGKKVVLSFAQQAGRALILCVDSDFDRLLGGRTEQSRIVNTNPFVVQTGVYAIENLLCLPSSLGSIATRITRNDTQVFDFDAFCASYSKAIYPLFVWYFHAAATDHPHIFTLADFRNTVKLNYLEVEDGGASTVRFVERQVQRRLNSLQTHNRHLIEAIEKTDQYLRDFGVKPDETHLYIQGHTWQDNVVKVMLNATCNYLRQLMIERITTSRQEPLTRRNDMSSYNNALRDIDTVVADNTLYRRTEYYRPIAERIHSIIDAKEQ